MLDVLSALLQLRSFLFVKAFYDQYSKTTAWIYAYVKMTLILIVLLVFIGSTLYVASIQTKLYLRLIGRIATYFFTLLALSFYKPRK